MSEKKLMNLFQRSYDYAKLNNYDCYIFRGTIYLRKRNNYNEEPEFIIESEVDLEKFKEDDFLDTSTLSFTGDFYEQLKKIVDHVCMSQAQVNRIKSLLDDLTGSLGDIWPGLQVHVFGSMVTGLANKTSDVDCYIQRPPVCMPGNPVLVARNRLKRYNLIFTNTLAVCRAKVPILKVFHIPTGFKCDINFSNLFGIRNSELIGFMLHLQPNALPLAILLKYWSKVYDITGTHLMSNYALTMMVIFYLQRKSVLPSVAELQQHTDCHYVGCWDTSFNHSFSRDMNHIGFYKLLGGFFEFYNNFDYEQFVISPYLGYLIRKQHLKNVNELPRKFDLYSENVRYGRCQALRLNTPICIQDPFEHSRNLTVAVSYELLARIKEHIAIVHKTFVTRSPDDFLKGMFTHELEFEPESATTRGGETGRANNFVMNRERIVPAQPVQMRYTNEQVNDNNAGDFFFKCLFVIVSFLIFLNLSTSNKST